MVRALLAVLLASLVAFPAATASGQSGSGASISVSITPAPAAALEPLVFIASGDETDGGGDTVEITFKPGAGATCASTPTADGGTSVPAPLDEASQMNPAGQPSQYYATAASEQNGNPIALTAGSYVVCAWLTDGNGDVQASTQDALTVAPFQGSVTFSGPPNPVLTKAQAAGSISYSVNSPSFLSIALQDPYMPDPQGPCPAKPLQEGTNIDGLSATSWNGMVGFQIGEVDEYATYGGPDDGPGIFSGGTGTEQEDYAQYLYNPVNQVLFGGPYRVCAWITSDDNDQDVIYGPVSYAFDVGKVSGTPTISGTHHGFSGAVDHIEIDLTGKATMVLSVSHVVHKAGRTKLVHLQTLSLAGHEGANTITVRRLDGHAIAPGSYSFTVTAEADGKKSASVTFVDTASR